MRKIKRASIRKAGLYICEIGTAGTLIGGMALDGPDLAAGLIVTGASAAVATAGYQLYRAAGRREKPEDSSRHDRDIFRRRDAVFRGWMEFGTLSAEGR